MTEDICYFCGSPEGVFKCKVTEGEGSIQSHCCPKCWEKFDAERSEYQCARCSKTLEECSCG